MPESKTPPLASLEIAARAELSDDAKNTFRENSSSEEYLDRLSQAGLFPDAVKYRAHVLESPSYIAWSLSCIRKLQAECTAPEQAAMQAVEKWLGEPTDENRRAAKTAAEQADLSTPAGCIALAVFFSEGSIAPSERQPVLAPLHLARKIAAGGILLAVVEQPAQAKERYKVCLQLGREVSAETAS